MEENHDGSAFSAFPQDLFSRMGVGFSKASLRVLGDALPRLNYSKWKLEDEGSVAVPSASAVPAAGATDDAAKEEPAEMQKEEPKKEGVPLEAQKDKEPSKEAPKEEAKGKKRWG